MQFGMKGADVSSTIVGGKLLMHEKQLLTIDPVAVAARSKQIAPQVWDRV